MEDASSVVGVLTKPDLAENANTVVEFLSNRKCPLEHGYYVVRTPSAEERKRGMTSTAVDSEFFWYSGARVRAQPER